MRPCLRIAALIALAALATGCAGEADLPPGVPTIPAPPPRRDGGEAFLLACAQAGCPRACEPAMDGGVACGVVCGEACATLCAQSRCETASGFGDAYCTNASGTRTWSADRACDDGNACTTGDVCVGLACIGPPSPSAVACDDGNVCTGGDHCDGHGECAGTKTVSDPIERFLNRASEANYAYGSPGSFTGFGYADQLTIFHSDAAGDLAIHELHDAATDRILSTASTEPGNYGGANGDTVIGRGFGSNVGGTVPLLRFKLPAGSGHCTSDSDCHFFTANPGEAPGGASAEASGIFVCPP
jgi:hypothetical protein